MDKMRTVLVLGSGPNVTRAKAWTKTGIDRIVAINNAWRVRDDWDCLIYPQDFPKDRMPDEFAHSQSTCSAEDYVPAVNVFGGFVFCGGTMAFTAAYWALHTFRPDVIAFLGCDMVYPNNGQTHFYGKGTPDPLREDPTLQSLEAKSARFQFMAARKKCAVVNLSDQSESRLVFPRATYSEVQGWTAEKSERHCVLFETSDMRTASSMALNGEAKLGYNAPSGRYWENLCRYDQVALRQIDDLWLKTAESFLAAA